MSDARSPLTQSLSFAGSSSASATSRPLKRRLTSTQELDFFTPAATSFKPRPYTPNTATTCVPQTKLPHVPRNHLRSLEAHALPSAGMDPSPSEPNVFFIHPPFSSFPDSDMHPDGLSYALMAENPEWFLDAADFVSTNSNNPQAISYPPYLEPPRGWCPAKKRDLKERGSEGWPEGEEPRLRCTFCRRTYAGVNAKSMWRRHVFEKHKIAMSNRRDGNDRPRGRGSNKENRQLLSGRTKDETHDSLVNMDVAPQSYADARNTSHKSRFRSLHPAEETRHRERRNDFPVPSAPLTAQKEFPVSLEDDNMSRPHPLSQSSLPPLSPPLTPQSPHSSDAANSSFQSSDGLLATSPALARSVIPPSPYNPLLTPTFRHSPPRLPSDQPWRFPSPSHPLHSRTRELFLSTLARDTNSPATKGPSVIEMNPAQVTPLLSRHIVGFEKGKVGVLDLETPESLAKLPRPSPRALFFKDRLPLPVADRMHSGGIHQVEESPLSRNSRKNMRNHKKMLSEVTDGWLSDGPLISPAPLALGCGGLLTAHDPFVAMYSSWGDIGTGNEDSRHRRTPPMSAPESESPVLRSSALPIGIDSSGVPIVGLGIGLLEPFPFPNDGTVPVELECEFDGRLIYPPITEEEGDEAEVEGVLTASNNLKGNAGRPSEHLLYHEMTPPSKKRRTVGHI